MDEDKCEVGYSDNLKKSGEATGILPYDLEKDLCSIYIHPAAEETDLVEDPTSTPTAKQPPLPKAPTKAPTTKAPCTVKFYDNDNRLIKTVTPTTTGQVRFESKIENSVFRYSQSASCGQIEYMDEDKCEVGYSDNLKKSGEATGILPYDLEKDLCGIYIHPAAEETDLVEDPTSTPTAKQPPLPKAPTKAPTTKAPCTVKFWSHDNRQPILTITPTT